MRIPSPRPHRRRRLAFTLVELLVVIGIIAILISILLPVIGKARARAQTLKCQSNLRQVSMAALMYANAYRGALPYTTTPHGESMLWFNAIDPFLASANNRTGATGVAVGRTYKAFKQCPVYETFEGDSTSGAQGKTKEYARTYKMNNLLRRVKTPSSFRAIDPSGSVTVVSDNFANARITDCRPASQFVFFGDGLSLDFTGPVDSQSESGQFSMEVDRVSEASPGLRHQGGANIAFVDGHVELITLPTISKQLASPKMNVKTWESEFMTQAGVATEPSGLYSFEQQQLKRNPRSPLVWSIPGKLYGRNS